MSLENRTFLVTGAGSGLGAAVAAHVIAEGGNVVMADRNAEAGAAAAEELGARAVFVATDVTDAAEAQAAVDTAVSRFGRLDALVNCAGIAAGKRIVGREGAHELELFSQVINVNLVGTFNMLRLAATAMAGQEPDARGERGVIVNTASVAAFDGQIGQAAYSASKGGIVSLTLPAARELARHGIRVMAIAPGIFATPMLLNMPQEVQDALAATVPFPHRLGEPREFAALVGHIFENQMLNGEVIRLDGALRMAAQ
ncbi:MAG: SDR family NAD(P)-dependent oxidoreductase [Alphaproteobacteria bacterium]|nr:MAG: SDR family NAD(P)-dependent oxidoreductase [Alphaproteobacteria bacterium]